MYGSEASCMIHTINLHRHVEYIHGHQTSYIGPENNRVNKFACIHVVCPYLIVRSIRSICLACQLTKQQYCSLVLNQHQPPATSHQSQPSEHNKSLFGFNSINQNIVSIVTFKSLKTERLDLTGPLDKNTLNRQYQLITLCEL